MRWGLALNLATALVLGLGLGSLQANADGLSVWVPPLVTALAGAGMMGALAGLTGRIILRGWPGALRFLLSLLAVLICVVLAEATYALWTGLHPLEYLWLADNWVEMGQLAIGCLSIAAVSLIGRSVRDTASIQWVYRQDDQAPTPAVVKSPLRWGLGLTLGVAVVLGAALGTLQANTDQSVISVPPLAAALIGAGIMGLLAGLSTTRILRGWTETLRLLVTLLALLVWMAVTEVTYAAWVGLQPLEFLWTADNWVEMGQLALGCLGAIVGGLARRRTCPVEAALALERGRATVTPHRAGRLRHTTRVRWRPVLSLPHFRVPAWRRHTPLPGTISPHVRVVGKNEDRCPYCLDVIGRKDPRGVATCEICHTPHHADCWAAGGGKCQVPHLVT